MKKMKWVIYRTHITNYKVLGIKTSKKKILL